MAQKGKAPMDTDPGRNWRRNINQIDTDLQKYLSPY